jgi:uncharacterized protein YkwD
MVRTAALDAMAQQWAEKLAADQKLSHRSADDLRSRVLGACEGPCNGWAENVAFGGDVSTIWSQWLNSQVHRDNIDAPYPGEYGFGVAVADDGSLYAVQNFGQYR